jgi:hypothetical protein
VPILGLMMKRIRLDWDSQDRLMSRSACTRPSEQMFTIKLLMLLILSDMSNLIETVEKQAFLGMLLMSLMLLNILRCLTFCVKINTSWLFA